MAYIKGFDGSVTFGTGHVVEVKGFSVSVSQDVRDVTTFSSSGWREKVYGCKNWTATVNALALSDSGSTPFDLSGGIQGSLLLTASTGNTLSGTAILSTQDMTRNTCEEATVTLNFEGNGELVMDWNGS